MPANLVRYQQTGNLHHINFTCYHNRPNLTPPSIKDLFEQSLERIRLRYDFWLTAYVVMPNHVHLLMSEPQNNTLAIAIQALKLSVAVQSTERPFWQKRYFDRNLWSESEVIKTRRYIHRNPVEAGLASLPGDWKWSSFNHWRTGCNSVVEIESNWIARSRGGLGMPLPK